MVGIEKGGSERQSWTCNQGRSVSWAKKTGHSPHQKKWFFNLQHFNFHFSKISFCTFLLEREKKSKFEMNVQCSKDFPISILCSYAAWSWWITTILPQQFFLQKCNKFIEFYISLEILQIYLPKLLYTIRQN